MCSGDSGYSGGDGGGGSVAHCSDFFLRRDYGFTKRKAAYLNSLQSQCSPKRRGRLKQSDDGAAKSRARMAQTKKKNENLPSDLP
jgi:hypothetical protein